MLTGNSFAFEITESFCAARLIFEQSAEFFLLSQPCDIVAGSGRSTRRWLNDELTSYFGMPAHLCCWPFSRGWCFCGASAILACGACA